MIKKTKDIKKDIALVSWAAGEVGKKIVDTLKENGWYVIGIDLKNSNANYSLIADVTNRRTIFDLIPKITNELGNIKLLVTSPINLTECEFGKASLMRWKSNLDLWLGGTINLCKAVVPQMISSGSGIVVTTSIDLSQEKNGYVYDATASGTIRGFTKSFACEVAPKGIRVNCISPKYPINSSGVAEMVLFLATEGTYYCGQDFSLCPKKSKEGEL